MKTSGKRRRSAHSESVSPNRVDVKAALVIATLADFQEKATVAIDEDHAILALVDELILKLSEVSLAHTELNGTLKACHKRITFGIIPFDGGPLTVAGIVHDKVNYQTYPPLDPSAVPARAARYREMGAPGTFMTAEVFDQLIETIQTHVCDRVRRSRFYSTVAPHSLTALYRPKLGAASSLMPSSSVLQPW